MSEIQVENITAKDSNSAPNFAGGNTFGGLSADSAIPGLLTPSLTVSNIEPDSATVTRGNFWFNDSGSGTLSLYNDGAWWTLGGSSASAGAGGAIAWYGDRAVHSWGSYSAGPLYYWSLTTYAAASSFGSLPSGTRRATTLSSATYGLWCGLEADTDGIEYVTISTPADATSFGNLTQFREDAPGASNGVIGCFGGGYESNYGTSLSPTVIDYVTIATPSNATDFGDMSFSRFQGAGCADATRGIFGGGWNHAASTQSNVIDYIEFNTPSNATDFGDLTVARRMFDACSDPTYGVFCAGSTPTASNVLDYITIQTTSNATDFGDLYGGSIMYNGAVSNGTDGFAFGGVDNTYSNQSNISTFTIATPANATLFGSMSANNHSKGCSGNS